jgi:GNAT superfamily N-acetyltransferase
VPIGGAHGRSAPKAVKRFVMSVKPGPHARSALAPWVGMRSAACAKRSGARILLVAGTAEGGRIDLRWTFYVRSALDYIRLAEYRSLARRAANAIHSEKAGIEVRKDLHGSVTAVRDPSKPLIRQASSADIFSLVGTDRDDSDVDDRWQRRLRRDIADTLGIEGCFVAESEGIGAAFMQYLFTAADNDRLRSSFPGQFPHLHEDEAMVEFLYVDPEARSPGLAVDCIVQVTEEASRRGAMSVISYIDPQNKGALFVNHLAGFRAHAVRRTRWRLLRKSYSFEPWPAGTSQRLIDFASGKARIV